MIKVLLVDDDQFVINGLKAMLNWDFFQGELVGEAGDGKAALSLALANRPDVVVADIKMPCMHGLELAKQLNEQLSDVQIIILSGHGDFEYAQKAIRYGVVSYILKPITREKINQLEQKLSEINLEHTIKEKANKTIGSKTMQEEIIKALKENNIDYFDALFQSNLFSEHGSTDSVVNMGLWLINCLYVFLEQLHVEKEAISVSREHCIEEFLALQARQAKHGFVSQKYYDVMQFVDEGKSSSTDSIVTFAKNYVNENFAEPGFNISYLADQLNISMPYLSTSFRRTTGINLSTYITAKRIERAKELLSDPSNSVSQTAQKIGYVDGHYFTKLFKKETGYSPSEYRNISLKGVGGDGGGVE